MLLLLGLVAGIICLLLYGSVSFWLLLPGLVLVLSCAAVCLKGHRHGSLADIDYYAQVSPLNAWSAGLKAASLLLIMLLCLTANSLAVCGFVLLSLAVLNIMGGRVPVAYYLSLLLLPASFIALSSLAIMLEISQAPAPFARFGVRIFGLHVYATPAGQSAALMVSAKAVAAVSCLYTLSLTTPAQNIISTLRRCKCPAVVIDLMYLIYRYIFILAKCLEDMTHAGRARLGYVSKRAALRTARLVGANLLRVSFKRAGANYDAMLARGYDGELRFLVRETRARKREYVFWFVYLSVVVGLGWL